MTLWHQYRPCDCSTPCDAGCHELYGIDVVCGEPPENHIVTAHRNSEPRYFGSGCVPRKDE